jgi:hypothetical protein
MQPLGYRDLSFADAVNSRFFVANSDGRVINLAIFRVVPTENKVVAPMDMFITVDDMNKIASVIRRMFDIILNIVSESDIITIPTALSPRLEKIKARRVKKDEAEAQGQQTLIEVSTVEF